jgi:hypothetical protein
MPRIRFAPTARESFLLYIIDMIEDKEVEKYVATASRHMFYSSEKTNRLEGLTKEEFERNKPFFDYYSLWSKQLQPHEDSMYRRSLIYMNQLVSKVDTRPPEDIKTLEEDTRLFIGNLRIKDSDSNSIKEREIEDFDFENEEKKLIEEFLKPS